MGRITALPPTDRIPLLPIRPLPPRGRAPPPALDALRPPPADPHNGAMHLLRRFVRAVDRLNDGLGAGLRWLALVMVLVGAYNAVARYATRFTGTQLSSNALNELQWYLFSVIFLLGAAYALRHDVHVRVDVLYGRLSRKGRAWIDLLGGVLFLLPFSALMLWVSWPAVRNSWVIRETSPDPGGLPRYPIKALILVSFGLLALQGIAEVTRNAALVRGARWPMEEEGEGNGAGGRPGAGEGGGEEAGMGDAGREGESTGPAGGVGATGPEVASDDDADGGPERHGRGL